MKNIEAIRKEWNEHKKEYRYMIYTCHKSNETYFEIEDINPDRILWGDFLFNFACYYKSIEECIKSVKGTQRPIIYKGENLNPIKEDVFLSYNPYTGEAYRNYIY